MKYTPSHTDLGCSLCPGIWVSPNVTVGAMNLGHKDQVALAVLRGKVEAIPSKQLDLKNRLLFLLSFIVEYRKDSLQGGWM